MPTSYDVLYESLLGKVRDYDWLQFTIEEIRGLANDYLRPAIVRFAYCKADLSDKDDVLGQFNVELSDMEIEILSDYIVIAWLNANYILTGTTLKQSMPSKDYQMWSPSNHLSRLERLHLRLLQEVDVLKTTYSRIKNKDSILRTITSNNRAKPNFILRGRRWWH